MIHQTLSQLTRHQFLLNYCRLRHRDLYRAATVTTSHRLLYWIGWIVVGGFVIASVWR